MWSRDSALGGLRVLSTWGLALLRSLPRCTPSRRSLTCSAAIDVLSIALSGATSVFVHRVFVIADFFVSSLAALGRIIELAILVPARRARPVFSCGITLSLAVSVLSGFFLFHCFLQRREEQVGAYVGRAGCSMGPSRAGILRENFKTPRHFCKLERWSEPAVQRPDSTLRKSWPGDIESQSVRLHVRTCRQCLV
jgi:hypothetical protein